MVSEGKGERARPQFGLPIPLLPKDSLTADGGS